MGRPLLSQITNLQPLTQAQYQAINAVYAGPNSPAKGNSYIVNLALPVIMITVPINLINIQTVEQAINYCEAMFIYQLTGTVCVSSKSSANATTTIPQYASTVQARSTLMAKMVQDEYSSHLKKNSLTGLVTPQS